MAKGKKTGGRDFKPGDPRAGRPSLPGDIKEARKLSQVELERLLNKYLWLDKQQFTEALKDPACTMFEAMVGSIIHKAVIGGDQQRLDWIVARLIGKITEKVEVALPEPVIVRRLNGEEIELGLRKGSLDEPK